MISWWLILFRGIDGTLTANLIKSAIAKVKMYSIISKPHFLRTYLESEPSISSNFDFYFRPCGMTHVLSSPLLMSRNVLISSSNKPCLYSYSLIMLASLNFA